MDDLTYAYQIYTAEYDRIEERLYRDEEGLVGKEIGTKLGKEGFKSIYELTRHEQFPTGSGLTPRQIIKLVARRQVEYIHPSNQERMLEIFEKPDAVNIMRETGYADLLEQPITKEDLQRGTPQARRLADFLNTKYKDYRSEGLSVEGAKLKVSQIFFGS